MPLIALPKRVPKLLLLALTALAFFIIVADWGSNKKTDKKIAPENQISSPVTPDKNQKLPYPLYSKNEDKMEVNLPPIAVPQMQVQKNIPQKSLKPAIARSWPEEEYRLEDDPYSLSEELQQTLKISGVDKNSDLQVLGERATRISTDLALELLSQIPSRPDQRSFLKGILSQLLAFSPTEAIAWTEQYLNNDMEETAFGFIGKLYAMQNPSEAADWAYGIENQTLRMKTYGNIALVWGANDFNSAYDWALRLEDYEEQSRVLLKLGTALAVDNPPAAANWALAFEDQGLGNKILATALNKWSLGGLPEAAQWAAELPEGMHKTVAVNRISSIWAQLNPPVSFEWAKAMSNGKARDLALKTISSLSSKSNPETAANSALAIEDDSLRLNTLARVLKNWNDQEPLSPARWTESIQDPNLRREVEQLLEP